MTDTVIDIFRNGLAEKFGIEYIRVSDGLVFVGDASDGSKKWYKPGQAAVISDQINAFAKAIMATKGSEAVVAQASELAYALAEAAQKAAALQEISRGTGNKVDIIEKQLTPLPGHAMDWDGANKKELEGLVYLALSMFPTLTEGEVGDIMRMSDIGGETKLGALKIQESFKASGRRIHARMAVNIYQDLANGKLGKMYLPGITD
jgi:hypothetical protein